MWLLNCWNYCLEEKDASQWRKAYWILSHTWSDDEVMFQDMQTPHLSDQRKGFRKIERMCDLAKTEGVSHVWIDTCCIDKTSSAELTESINSMFDWYEVSKRCIVYLEDLPQEQVWLPRMGSENAGGSPAVGHSRS